MSRDARPSMSRTHRVVPAVIAAVVVGCGRDANQTKTVGRAGADSAPAPAAQRSVVADSAPTPGFTSARGTPPSQPAPPIAPAADAARMAPPPPATLASQLSAEEQAALRALPAGPGHELVLGTCLTCHSATMITQQHKDTAAWNKTVTQMIAWGAPVAKDQQATLVAYLFEHFPARAAGESVRPAP